MPKETHMPNSEKFQVKTAILVDGGFYRKRSTQLLGYKTPVDRANELHDYCHQHLRDNLEHRQLYRVFYYDCPPSTKNVYNPLTQRTINFVLDPMRSPIRPDLYEHIDGIRTPYSLPKFNEQ